MSETVPATPAAARRVEGTSPARRGRGRMAAIVLVGLVALGLVVASMAGLLGGGRGGDGLTFVIPAGASAHVARPTIDSAIAIPTDIRFAPGETATITIRNEDAVDHRAGPFLVGAGQTLVQRFPAPGRYPIACSVDPLESVVVTVAG